MSGTTCSSSPNFRIDVIVSSLRELQQGGYYCLLVHFLFSSSVFVCILIFLSYIVSHLSEISVSKG